MNISYIKNKDFNQPVGRHFNARGHTISDFQAIILEKVYSSNKLVREERESMWIGKFNSKYKGMNTNS